MINLLIVCLCAVFIATYTQNYVNEHKVLDSNLVTLEKTVDGDTAWFLIDGEKVKVRFLAIDTPETVKPNTTVQAYGKEASDYTANELKNAKEIKLEYEESNLIDKYGRTLAYVFVDGELLQEKLLENGLAKMTCKCAGYRYLNRMIKAQTEAQNAKIGMWEK